MKGFACLFTAALGIVTVAVPAIAACYIDRSAVDFVAPADIKWVRNAAGTSEQAVLFGDPTKPGPYVIRIRWLPGNMSRPHSHSTAGLLHCARRHLVPRHRHQVRSRQHREAKPGTYVFHKAGGIHYDGAKNEPAVIQVWGTGPMTTTQAEQP